MRRAAVDIGTNSVLLLIADVTPTGITRVHERAEITRLGAGVDATRALSPEAIARTLTALRDYADDLLAHHVTALRVVATSAVRDARNRDEFLVPAQEALGVAVETLSGEDEARATFRGALLGLPLERDAPVITFDIGGGSTEVIVGRVGAREPSSARSVDIGAVRLTERHVRSDPPADGELFALRASADHALATLGTAPPLHALVGIAGTVTTLAALHGAVSPYDPSRIHGASLSRHAIDALVAEMATLPLAVRRGLPGLDPRRADVIVAGAIVVQAVMDWAGVASITVSDGGVRVGLLVD